MRTLFKLSALLMAGLLPLAAEAAEKLRFGHVAPPGSLYDRVANGFADKVKAASAGQLEVEVLGNGVLGAQPQMLAQLRTGALDFWVIDTGGLALTKEGRDFSVLMAPYLFRDQQHYQKFVDGPLLAEMMVKVERELNIRHVGVLTYNPPRALSTGNKPVRSPADLKGLKIRVPEAPVFLAIWKEWGATPTPVKATDLFQALQSGMVDGQENGVNLMTEASYSEVQKYFMPIDYVLSGLSLFMSAQTWAKLDERQRRWVSDAAAAVAKDSQAAWPAYMGGLLGKAKAAGMTIVEPDRASFAAAADVVGQKFDGEMWSKGLWQRIRDIR